MASERFDLVDSKKFTSRYMGTNAQSFAFQHKSIQVYPLSVASSFIPTPSALFRAQYNFLLLFSAGGGLQQVDNEEVALKPNDALFIREGHLNAIKSIDPATDGYYLYIDNALLPQIFTDRTLLNRLTFYPKHTVEAIDMQWLCNCCALLSQQSSENAYSQDIRLVYWLIITLKTSSAEMHQLLSNI